MDNRNNDRSLWSDKNLDEFKKLNVHYIIIAITILVLILLAFA